MKSGASKAGRSSRLKLVALLALCSTLGASSCATGRQVVLIDSDGALLRADELEGTVFFLNARGEWERGGNRVKVPRGWFVGPMPAKK